jgi:predicted transcriptional regulator of viral defense system
MEFSFLLQIIENEPVFETGLLLTGDVNALDVRKQLSRWTAAGKIFQLRRGLYCLAPPYQKVIPHPFLLANRLRSGSYVSLQSALAYYGMIPENVPVTTSITTGRPENIQTPLGQFDFRHITVNWFSGYRQIDLDNDQKAFIATPEKALLELVYLQAGGETDAYLREMRLQALENLDMEKLRSLANVADKPKLLRAVDVIQNLASEEKSEYVSL